MYSQAGTWTAIAGIVVLVAGFFGIHILPTDAQTLVGDVVSFVGIVMQYNLHKNLAIATGTFPRKA